MKKIIIVILLCANSSIFARTIFPDMPIESCEVTCHSVGHTFAQHGRFTICHDVQSCDVLKWNDDLDACELLKTENRKLPIACRDIPPAF